MPRGDGTGPLGRGQGQAGGGPGGECICPSCGVAVPHQLGIPCYSVTCPRCGTPMVRG